MAITPKLVQFLLRMHSVRKHIISCTCIFDFDKPFTMLLPSMHCPIFFHSSDHSLLFIAARNTSAIHAAVDGYLEYLQQSQQGEGMTAFLNSAKERYKAGHTLLLPKTDKDSVESEVHADLSEMYDADDYFLRKVIICIIHLRQI